MCDVSSLDSEIKKTEGGARKRLRFFRMSHFLPVKLLHGKRRYHKMFPSQKRQQASL